MSEIAPDRWQRRSLSSLGEYENGFAFNELHWSEQGLPIVRIAQITGTQGIVDRYPGWLPDTFRIDSGDLIFSWSGTLAVVRWAGGPAWLNQHLFKVVPAAGIDRSLLFHLLQASVAEMNKRTHGSTMKHIKRSELREFFVALPVCGDEQRKLAQVLDTLDTAVHETAAIIAKLKAVKQGLLHDLLTRGIDTNGELRPPQADAPHLYKESPLGWIPKEWAFSSVGAQFEIQLGKMLDGQKNSGVLKPYVGNKAVQWNRIDLNEVQQVRLSKSDLGRFRLQKGDLLVCEGGEVGRAAIWNDQLDECYYQKALHRLRPVHGYDPRLMLEMLRYLMGRDALSEYISKTSIAHLTQEKLANVPLPTPNLNEQRRLVAAVVAANQRQEAEESQLQKFASLKAGLMDDLLTGRVRVTPLLEGTTP
jgi:type I restriction enzyme S subunit